MMKRLHACSPIRTGAASYYRHSSLASKPKSNQNQARFFPGLGPAGKLTKLKRLIDAQRHKAAAVVPAAAIYQNPAPDVSGCLDIFMILSRSPYKQNCHAAYKKLHVI